MCVTKSQQCRLYETQFINNIGLQISDLVKHRELYDMVVMYEDILSDPEAACERLLEVCRIPARHLPAAMGAFQTDSQNGAFGKRGSNKYRMLSRQGNCSILLPDFTMTLSTLSAIRTFRRFC